VSTWDDYLWEPGGDVLRNRLGIYDKAALRVAEYSATARRLAELARGDVAIARTFDATHLRAIHRHIFQDVYEWAGEWRTVDMSRPGSSLFAARVRIDATLERAAEVIAATSWPQLSAGECATPLAQVAVLVNFAHPFREGNGRAYKIFLQQLADQADVVLDFERCTPASWNDAFRESMPVDGGRVPSAYPLVRVFTHIARPAATPQAGLPIYDFGLSRFDLVTPDAIDHEL
jgi:cell filamentation protein